MLNQRLLAPNLGRRLALILSSISMLSSPLAAASNDQWLHFGQDERNQRNQANEKTLGPDNVGHMVTRWNTDLRAYDPQNPGGDVWTTPAMDKNNLYFPDSAGYLYSMDRDTGNVVWRRNIAEYSAKPPHSNNFSRTTPAISGNTLIIGDHANRFPFYNGPLENAVGAEIMAVDKDTGDPLWTTVVDDHHYSIITTSPTIFKGQVLVGVSSYESAYALHLLFGLPPEWINPAYQPSSRGSLMALDLETGEILWRRYTITAEFSGGSIWGSSPSIDKQRNQVFVGTGQNFSMPEDVKACAQDAYENVEPGEDPAEAARSCFDDYPDNYFDSILAIDLATGKVNWGKRIVGYDTWHVACLVGLDFLCPNPTGTDADFGQSPIFFTIGKGKEKRDVIGVGQKSGRYWVLDAVNGDLVWTKQVSPGGIAGGIQWGSAYDGDRIYTSSANSNNIPYQLVDGSTASGGIWSALDPQSGEILWQTADPNNAKSGGAASIANGVVYVCSWDTEGTMYALDASDGAILWQHGSGGTCNSGAAIGDGNVFWGSGYDSLGTPVPANGMWSFGLPD